MNALLLFTILGVQVTRPEFFVSGVATEFSSDISYRDLKGVAINQKWVELKTAESDSIWVDLNSTGIQAAMYLTEYVKQAKLNEDPELIANLQAKIAYSYFYREIDAESNRQPEFHVWVEPTLALTFNRDTEKIRKFVSTNMQRVPRVPVVSEKFKSFSKVKPYLASEIRLTVMAFKGTNVIRKKAFPEVTKVVLEFEDIVTENLKSAFKDNLPSSLKGAVQQFVEYQNRGLSLGEVQKLHPGVQGVSEIQNSFTLHNVSPSYTFNIKIGNEIFAITLESP